MDESIAPTRWGRVRFGSRRMPAMAVAVPTGFVVAALFGAAGAILRPELPERPEAPLLFGIILGLCLWVPSLALVWALAVVAIWRLEFTATLALLGVVLFAMGSFAVRYVLCARRG